MPDDSLLARAQRFTTHDDQARDLIIELTEALEISAHTQPEPPRPQESATDVFYAWQMLNDREEWNIMGLQMPNGQYLPMVTTMPKLAWESIDVAQAHANRNGTRVRLAAFSLGDVIAILDPDVDPS